MRILVLGSGGREHAIISTLRRTSLQKDLELYCLPGNAGIAQDATCLPISVDDHAALAGFAESEAIDFTFVGPEAPLAAGVVDYFQSRGLRIVGPDAAAAKLEASKVMAKDFMARHHVPTANYRVANSLEEAMATLESGAFGGVADPIVIKADGLAAGKGVVVAGSRAEAATAVEDLISGKRVGTEAAHRLVIEEALPGTEVSVLLFADGRSYKVMPPARDHKRIGENDTGPNTGGMGAVTEVNLLEAATLERIEREIIVPTLRGAEQEGFRFKGILFIGIMLTPKGPKVLEYNVRFGDPETQAILVRLESDLAFIFESILNGSLGDVDVCWSAEASACVVLASQGYPGKYETGVPISGLAVAANKSRVHLFHAGTALGESGSFVTAGGRVLGVTATGNDLNGALNACYDAINEIRWRGMQYRRDIGRVKAASMP
jgi:phosphoribosylamine--glycine ligase